MPHAVPAAGKPAPQRANLWPPEQAAEVLGRYVAGESGEEIAESLGLTPSRVYRLLRKRKLSDGSAVLRSRVETRRMGGGGIGSQGTPKVRKELSAEVAEEIVACYVAGEPAGYITAAVGVSDERVYRLLRARLACCGP